MLTHAVTEQEIQEMRTVWKQWHSRLTPNRRSGTELIAWLQARYPVTECFGEEALACVRDNVLLNECSREKLPEGLQPQPRAFYIENSGTGAALYTPEVSAFGIERIWVGIDTVTGEFQVEASGPLWDALFAFRGLDERDLENPFLVWQYVQLQYGGCAMEIRRAAAGDIPGLTKLLHQVLMVHHNGRPDLFKPDCTKYTDAELAELLADETRPVFAAFAEGEMLGYAFCMLEEYQNDNILTDRKTLYIDDICVDEQARGRHVGTALYEHVIAYAREIGCYNVTLNVWECNPGADAFYRAMGMKPYKTGMETIL